jgi:hypothetical protein
MESHEFTRTRQRDYPVVVRDGQGFSQEVFAYSSGPYEFKGGKVIHDSQHLAWMEAGRELRKSNPGVLRAVHWGGPLIIRDRKYEDGDVNYDVFSSNYVHPRYRSYVGDLLPAQTSGDYQSTSPRSPWAPYEESSDSTLDAFGTSAIAVVSPAKPHASVLTALGELYRDGLPAITGLQALRGKKPSDVGAEYLNYEFGIKPLLSDLRKLHHTVREANKILSQYQRDAGRWVRRRYEPDPVTSVERVVMGTNWSALPYPALDSGLYASVNGAQKTLVTEISRKQWFSGAFSYPSLISESDMGKLKDLMQRYNHLYGILPTPEVIWNLTPWSWAADWVTSMGDIMSNISMLLIDGLVMKYGFVMEHSSVTRTYSISGLRLRRGYGSQPYTGWQRFSTESKLRRRATPYGFGLNDEDFSPRQWAILVALGLSKGSKVGW